MERKKSILLFTDSLGAGGAQRQLVGLAYLLKRKGYLVKVVTYYNFSFYSDLLYENNIEHECLNKHSYLSILKLFSLIKIDRPDIIISYQTNPNILICICRIFRKLHLIVSERNTHTKTTYKDIIAFNLYRLSNYIIPNSYSEEKYIKKYFPFLKNKIVTISNFVDLDYFKPIHNKDRFFQRNMIIVASIKPSKNTKAFIIALKRSIDQGCKLNVLWYGINPEENELSPQYKYTSECLNLIEKYKLYPQIQLLPKTKHIKKEYNNANIFCLPSIFEGTPNVICEAMAMGLPVICSDICDNPYYIREGENGYLFDPSNIDSITESILKIESLPDEKLQEIGEKNRKKIERKCSPNDFINKYITLIDTLND